MRHVEILVPLVQDMVASVDTARDGTQPAALSDVQLHAAGDMDAPGDVSDVPEAGNAASADRKDWRELERDRPNKIAAGLWLCDHLGRLHVRTYQFVPKPPRIHAWRQYTRTNQFKS
jgi:hypothetical protein